MTYNILIVGYGHVGAAVASVFKHDKVTVIDPKFNKNKISDFMCVKFDMVFVCVDTPQGERFKTLDSILKQLNDYSCMGTVVCCKSTATPHFYESAAKKYRNICILHSPEYLSHWNNIEDFKNQKFLIVGGNVHAAKKAIIILSNRLEHLKTTKITDIKTAALVKYSENTFLALKVTFANEMYKVHKQLGCPSEFKEYAELLGLDERIGPTHLQVPGRDGKFGWGGHCYEKDVHEMEQFSKSELVKCLRKLNKQHRKQA
jgi:UDPglucose 6-dehydrogenase